MSTREQRIRAYTQMLAPPNELANLARGCCLAGIRRSQFYDTRRASSGGRR